jgi:FtsP/CotA-like multicopper oxidase with cupredoxin domain
MQAYAMLRSAAEFLVQDDPHSPVPYLVFKAIDWGRLGTAERWIVTNGSGGWDHPFHVHVENYQVLKRNGKTPPVIERGRKDIMNLAGGDSIEIFIQFHRYAGRYTVHCHNTGHEDLAMMGWVDVQP